MFWKSYAVLNFKTHKKECVLLSVTKQTPGCFEHIKWPHDGWVAFHTARQQSASLNGTEEAYCAESDLRSSKEWKSRIAKQADPKQSVNSLIIVLKCENTKGQNSEGLTSPTSRLHSVHLPVTLGSIFSSPFDLRISLTSDFVKKLSNST
jgi:hypothetical protein